MPAAPPSPSSVSTPLLLEAADGVTRPLGDRFFLLVGRLHPREREKGHQQLLAALPPVLGAFPDVQLVFPGPGDDRPYVASLARVAHLGDRVFLPGNVTDDVLKQLYQRCYAFAMPSRQEGFGLVYAEAMSYAKACIGCFEQGAEDVIVPGETGLLVHDPDDAAELSEALLSLLRDPAETRRMGERGLERVRTHFTARHHQERVKQMVASAL